jgi:autoinducer 2-degrading protein
VIVNVITIQVKPEHIEEFLAATVENHKGTRTEPGNIRFDVIQSVDDPGRVMLYEVFASQEAIEAHRRTAHYQAWAAKVPEWLAKPRERASHRVIAPADRSAW